jgi:hypothetical protein
MSLGNVARVVAVLAACIAAVGSASSTSNNASNGNPPPQYGQNGAGGPPPPQQMDPARALGLWRSTFGAVKVEADEAHGGLQVGAVHGVWTYQRQGQEIIGYFAGTLRGNVLQFRWQEPNDPPLVGEGYLVFDQQGRQYNGRWWTDRRDRVGDWNGWRQTVAQRPDPYAPYAPNTQDPNQPDGSYGPPPQQQRYPQQRYPRQQYPQQQPPPQPQPQQQAPTYY